MNAFLQMLRGSSDNPDAVEHGIGLFVFSFLLVFLGVLAVGALFVWMIRRHMRSRALLPLADHEHAPWIPGMRLPNMWFDSTARWVAIKCTDLQAVQSALNLHNPTTCSWEEGLAEARDRKLFISPPIGEWILVVGSGLPDPGDDVDICFHFLTRLSRKLGQVQFFSLNRVVHHHAWARLEGGQVIRAYAWAGHVVWNQGRPSLAEVDLRLHCQDYGEPERAVGYGQPDPMALNTEKLPALAERWSVNPTAIDGRHFRTGEGITGDLSSSRPS